MTIKKGQYTPWGIAQTVETIADGITLIDTPSHGGYHLSHSRMIEFRRLFPNACLWAGEGWFEEDSDWCLVALTFPQYFTPENLQYAIKERARVLAQRETDAERIA